MLRFHHKFGCLSNIYLERQIYFPKTHFPKTGNLILAGNIGVPGGKALKSFLLECKMKYNRVLYVPGPYEYRNKKLTKEQTDTELRSLCETTGVDLLNRSYRDFTDLALSGVEKTEYRILGCPLWPLQNKRNGKGRKDKEVNMKNHTEDFKWLKDALIKTERIPNIIVSHFLPYKYLHPSRTLLNDARKTNLQDSIVKNVIRDIARHHSIHDTMKPSLKMVSSESEEFLDTDSTMYWIFGGIHARGFATLGVSDGGMLSYRELEFYVNSLMFDQLRR